MQRLLANVVLLALALLASCGRQVPRLQGDLERAEPWPADFVERFGALPVQHEGRVMPFSTLAATTLYAVHGRRDVQFEAVPPAAGAIPTPQAFKLSPTEWLLDVWCFPGQAERYPLFRIENVSVLETLGFQHDGQTQGFEYLPYGQLVAQGQKLQELAQAAEKKPQSQRSAVDEQVAQLFRQLLVYWRLHQQHAALQSEMKVEGDALRAVFGGVATLRVEGLMQKADAFRAYVKEAGETFEDQKHGNLADLLLFLSDAATTRSGPSLLPPLRPREQEDTWHTVPEALDRAMRGAAEAQHAAMIGRLQDGLLAKDMKERVGALDAYLGAVSAAASARGEGGAVALESYYYRANWHFHAMMTFVAAFLAAVAACVLPRNGLVWWASYAASWLAVALLVADVWLRCVITGHPPITRLYDTFLFIGGVGALTLLIAEWILRRRVALTLAPFCGALFIFFARLFEVADGQDTMKPLQAVLLSNFWLGVHVPTMNIGYAAGVAAALVAMAWIAVRVLRIDHPDAPLAKSLYRMAYGVTCFSLATSVVGTILGGVWANDSWGRFWGWDPKENGALLICLAQIALLHARMSGMVRDAGFALWTVATGAIVVFSWFHTNLLGVGLHAYGFSSELLTGVWVSYSVLGLFLVAGALDVLLRPKPAPIDTLPAADALATGR
ncbi:MAG: hypothetical protein FJ301_09075 [Planctomycetes bacterium]|nr:hypothetical protein [Planctomycetota bacterium]